MTNKESNDRLRDLVTARLGEHRQTLSAWEQNETEGDSGQRAAMIRELRAVIYELELLLKSAPENPGEK